MKTPPEGITELPNGAWVVTGDSHYAAWIAQHGLQCDPHLFAWLRKKLDWNRIDAVWDVGACCGDHTDFYLSLGKRVAAFEPNPLAFACLAHNCPKAECYNFGASDNYATLSFAASKNLGASHISPNGEMEIEVRPLDVCDYLPIPQFVKIDCEGFEIHALDGMREILRKYHPALYIEVNAGALARNGHSREDLKNRIFGDLKYNKVSIYPENIRQEETAPQYDILVEYVP